MKTLIVCRSDTRIQSTDSDGPNLDRLTWSFKVFGGPADPELGSSTGGSRNRADISTNEERLYRENRDRSDKRVEALVGGGTWVPTDRAEWRNVTVKGIEDENGNFVSVYPEFDDVDGTLSARYVDTNQ